MNSIHIIGSKASGGAENFYARLVSSLHEQTHVLAMNPPDSAVSRQIDPHVKQLHPPMSSAWDFRGRCFIRKAARQTKPVIVQTYMGRATRLTHLPRGKGLVHVARLGGYYNLKAYRHAHHLIGNTKGICNYLIKEGVPAARVHCIGNFVEPILPPPAEELDALRTSLNIPDDTFVITCAARFHKNKGLPDLLDAFSNVWKRLRRGADSFSNHWKDARLILVGDGPLNEEIRKNIQALEIGEAVILPGWRDPAPYYHLADVLVSPSRHEPLGNTILEAWACGKPLVATATMGATELITPEQNGLITPLQSPVALAGAFEKLMHDPALCASLAAGGAQTVQDQFSKEIITNEYLFLYEQLLHNVL
jgi:glycosyltransferase involved in cell wall biosynthesis